MGATFGPSTPPGALTPICNDCGICLCWDISVDEYEEDKPFWDAWICQDCNGGVRLSLTVWRNEQPTA